MAMTEGAMPEALPGGMPPKKKKRGEEAAPATMAPPVSTPMSGAAFPAAEAAYCGAKGGAAFGK